MENQQILTTNLRNFNPNNPHNYPNSFNYKENKSNYDQLNFVYLIELNLYKKIQEKFGIQTHRFHEDNDDKETSAVSAFDYSNKELIDMQQIQKLSYVSKNPKFRELSYILKNIEQSDIKYVNQSVAEFLEKEIPEFTIVKKVAYLSSNQVKFELFNPIVNVLILSNDYVTKKNYHKNLKDKVFRICISRYMSRTDLSNVLIEICQEKLQIQNSELGGYKILLPQQNEISSKHFKNILKCQAEVVEIKQDNLSKYEIYQDKLIVFYYKDRHEDYKLKFRQRKNSAAPIENTVVKATCKFCSEAVDPMQAEYCICKNRYCDTRCRQRDQKHDCQPLTCQACDLKMIERDLGSLHYCQCGELLCQKRCLSVHQRKSGCSRVNMKPLQNLNNGQIGLSNIGNTCYMNSALQCLLHSDSLKKYFCFKDFSKEINVNNPLGTKGQLLNEFSNLFRTYYSTSQNCITPSDLKYCISQHLTTFEGYAQHDSQELLSSVMDSVHEDLNRILHKPSTQPIEGALGQNIEKLARDSWINYLQRNYSLFTQDFYGQFKSVVICPDCKNNSVTFDPFQVVSLSIPTLERQRVEYFYIDADQNSKAIKSELSLESVHKFNDRKVKEIKQKFCQIIQKPEEDIVFAALGFASIGEVFSDEDCVSQILFARQKLVNKPKIFACELNDYEKRCKKSKFSQFVFLKHDYQCYDQKEKQSAYELYQLKREYQENPIFTKLTIVDENTTVQDLHAIVLRKLFRVTDLFGKWQERQQNQSVHQYFLHMLEQLVTKLKNRQFFYIKVENQDEILSPFDSTKLLNKVDINKKIVLRVFIKTKDNTTTQMELEQFTSCVQNDDFDMEFRPDDMSSFKKNFTLDTLLKNFSMEEILDEQNSWYCNKCKNHVRATKTLSIYKIPHYLIIHLKKLKKFSTQTPTVEFPTQNLEMSQYIINQQTIQQYNIEPEEFYQPQDLQHFIDQGISPIISPSINSKSLKYDLYGVVDHSGSQNFGHYTAKCKLDNGQWCNFNDARTCIIDESDVVSQKAYLLFYKRNNQQKFQFNFIMEAKEKEWIDTIQQQITIECFKAVDSLEEEFLQVEKFCQQTNVPLGFKNIRESLEQAIQKNMDRLEKYCQKNQPTNEYEDIQYLDNSLNKNNKKQIINTIKKVEEACEEFKQRRLQQQKEGIQNMFLKINQEQFRGENNDYNLEQQQQKMITQVEEHEQCLVNFQELLSSFMLAQEGLGEKLKTQQLNQFKIQRLQL